jgi:hypothetical protein
MMWTDPIVDEVRAAREDIAREFAFDLRRLIDDLQREQAQSGRPVVRLEPRGTAASPPRRSE